MNSPSDADLLKFMAHCEFATTAGEYICQVITPYGTFQAYHKQPKVGSPFIHPSRYDALKAALLDALAETEKQAKWLMDQAACAKAE